jgi:stage II sporulation SpoAA-like protein
MPIVCRVEDNILVIRASGVVRMADIEQLAAEEEAYFATPGCPGLFLSDNSELKVISPDGADALVERMKVDTGRIAKSAFVVAEGTAALQLKRMVRDAGSEKRRTFTSFEQAWAWLHQ